MPDLPTRVHMAQDELARLRDEIKEKKVEVQLLQQEILQSEKQNSKVYRQSE